MPLHGITDPTSPLYQAGAERTFDLDLVNNATGAAGPDGVIDPSGSYFINLTSLLTSRDNLREAAVDIVQLAKSLPGLDLDGDTVADIDAARIHYLGHLARQHRRHGRERDADPDGLRLPQRAGRRRRDLLRDSQAFGPAINAGLAAKGLQPNTTLYEQFFRDAQTAVDAGDPLNYIAATVAARPVLVDAGAERHGDSELGDAAPHRRGAVREDRDAGVQPRRRRHGHLGALHLGLARLAPDPPRPPSEPCRDHRNADARGLARRVRGRRVRDHEPGHPGTLTAAEGSFFARLRARVNRGAAFVANLLPGRRIDAELLDELETRLLEADVGVEATQEILSDLHKKVARAELADAKALEDALAGSLLAILKPIERPLTVDRAKKPFVILVVGVNGSGKTTTIGKLARLLKDQGLSVLLAAGDTFRAAAVEQLAVWAERNGVPIVSQATGADPAAVVFDALQSAKARGSDVLIADTAGRLHTQSHLMDELAKIARVIKRLDPEAPHEVLLVLDASLGQNAVRQAEQFSQAIGVTGIVVTKLDGTAKGGIVVAIARRFGLPIRFVGIGEQAEDFGIFDARAYVEGLLRPVAVDTP